MKIAANGGWAFNLAGGYHHARPALAHGFCLIADVAVALAATEISGPVLVLDLDTHQGDGNAVSLKDHTNVFTASLHEEAAFPQPKPPSDIDRGLPPGIDDDAYLTILDELLIEIEQKISPAVVVYVAGTDVLAGDPLGAQSLSPQGVIERDRRTARWVKAKGAGLVALPAGGYSEASPHVAADGFAAMAKIAWDDALRF